MKLHHALILTASISTLLAPSSHAAPKSVFESTIIRGPQSTPVRVELKGAKQVYLVVTDGGDGFTADWADWAEPTFVKADGSKIRVTDLAWRDAKAGFGEVRKNANAGGKPLQIAGKPVEFGIGTHAPSLITFDVPEGAVAFEARGGIDNGGSDQGGGKGGSVTFAVFTERPEEKQLPASQTGAAPSAKPYGLEAAKQAVSEMEVAEGLQVGLFAAEPQIQNPTNIEVDPSGRVWALEQVNYRKWANPPLRPAGDRVVILQDTDGDGLADKETTFYQSPELNNPLGICVLPGPGGKKAGTQVIVSAAPNVWLLTDTDGDDKADKITKLLTGIRGEQHDHSIHAFTFGADGKFYWNMGNAGVEIRDPEGNIVTDLDGNQITDKGKPYRQGMVFRADLREGKLQNIETLGWNFRNNYEVAADSFGTLWQSDNDDDGNKGVRINYVMEGGNYGYTDEITGAGWSSPRTNLETEIPLRHWHQNDPGTIPNLLQTGQGSPTGILVNEGAALGPQFANQLIHCDAGPRTVRAYPVEKSGAGYKATMVDILTAPKDSWYRPSDVAIAPDGSLFIADWYDPGVGGHAAGDSDPEKIRGRLYRVSLKGAKPSVPTQDFSTADGAVAALRSPNAPTRYVAWQALNSLGAKAEPALLQLAKDANPRFRARAYGLLARLPGKGAGHLRAALSDADADVRTAAVRLSAELAKSHVLDTSPLEADQALVGKLMKDPAPQVRRQIAVSLANSKEIAQLWTALALQHGGADRWYLEALGIGSRGNEDACLGGYLTAVGDKWDTPAGRDIIWRVRGSQAPALLAKIIAGSSVSDSEKPRFIRSFDFLPDTAEKNNALLSLAALGSKNEAASLEALGRLARTDLASKPEVQAALENVLAGAKGSPRLVELVRDFHLRGQAAALLEVAAKDPSGALSVDAVKLALDEPNGWPLTTDALAKGARIADLLANTPKGVALLSAFVTDANREVAQRTAAVQALARTPAGVAEVLKLSAAGKFPEQLKAAATTALQAVQLPQFKDQIAAQFPAPTGLGGAKLPSIAELAKLPGDAARGKTIAERAETTCITCHRIGAVGVDFAPALSEIGTKLGKEALFDAIINPNAGVSMGFETTQVSLKNGSGALGIVRSETADEVVLAMPMGVTAKFAKRDIAKREKLPNSMMPSGLNQALSPQDLVDLVEYLSSLKKK